MCMVCATCVVGYMWRSAHPELHTYMYVCTHSETMYFNHNSSNFYMSYMHVHTGIAHSVMKPPQ